MTRTGSPSQPGSGFALAHLAAVFYAQEQYETSAMYYAQATEIFQEVNLEWVRVHSKWLGFVLLRQQRWREAYTCFVHSLLPHREQGLSLESVLILTGFAGVAAGQGRLERAAQLLGATATTQVSMVWYSRVFKPEYERIHASVRHALGAEAFENAFARGRALTLDQAIALALADAPIQ